MLHVHIGANPKLGRLTDGQFRAHLSGVLAIAASAEPRGYLLVGSLPATPQDVGRVAGVSPAVAAGALKKLRELGILEHDDAIGTDHVHNWEEHNPAPKFTGAPVDPTGARRQALFRNTSLRQAIRERDDDQCRYCGLAVEWANRRGPSGGTYDHVDPLGENSLENLVVACRACNTAKGSRTPENAGMVIQPEPTPDLGPHPDPS